MDGLLKKKKYDNRTIYVGIIICRLSFPTKSNLMLVKKFCIAFFNVSTLYISTVTEYFLTVEKHQSHTYL